MDLRQLQLETERLVLEPVSEKYAEQIFLEYSEPVTTYMNYGAPENLDILKKRIKERESKYKEGTDIFMAVLLKDSDEFLGCFGLEDLDTDTPEFGGWLKKSAHGNGYGKEATSALKQWADTHFKYRHLIWPCVSENAPSRKLAESLGGNIEREYEKTTASGKTWSYVEYWIPRM